MVCSRIEIFLLGFLEKRYLGYVSLGESENGFVIPDHMDSSTPKKRKIRKIRQDRLEAHNIYIRTIFLSYCPRIQLEWNTNNL